MKRSYKLAVAGAILFFLILLNTQLGAEARADLILVNELLQEVNELRARESLEQFIGLPKLHLVAKRHTEEMDRLNYFSSTSPVPERSSLSQRMTLEGLESDRVTQKNFRCDGLTDEQFVEFCLNSWLTKESFRRRLLSEDYSHVGFGVKKQGQSWLVTLVFAGGVRELADKSGEVVAGSEGCHILAQRVFELSNEARLEQGMAELRNDERLSVAAEGHSEEMMRLEYFSHYSPNKERYRVRQRVQLAGENPIRVSENIYQCSGYPPERVPKMAILSWLNSPGHRRNLLSSNHNSVGIGVAVRGRHVCVTQVFSGDQ